MARSFRFLETLGAGAFGEVHLAEMHTDEDFVQTVAVKSLHAQFSDDPELAGRLRDEARLLGLLQHPNIVRVSGLTRIDGRLAVLMEPVAGRDLTGAHVPPRATADIVAAVADALDAAWVTIPPGRTEPLRVVHRDIKPSNIMVTRRGLVKVMDFGVARATFDAREAQTRSQQYGTARYMAPERWLDGIAEAPSDVFSLGITLIELAGGQAVARPRLSREGFEADVAEALERLDPWPELQALARDMVAFTPDARPTAADVGSRAADLTLEGPGLRSWAATIEPVKGTEDALTGTVVVEDTDAGTFALGSSGTTRPPGTGPTADVAEPTTTAALPDPTIPAPAAVPASEPSGPESRPAWLPFAAGGVLVLGGLAFAGLSGVFDAPPTPGPEPASVAPVPEPEPAPQPPNPAPEPEPEPEPEPKAEPEPAPVQPATPAPPPAPEPTPDPVPEPVPEPEPEPEPDATPRVTLIFNVDAGLRTTVAGRALEGGRTAVEVPAGNVLPLEVVGPTRTFGCSILVGSVTEIWHIRDDGRCVKTG